MVNMCLHGGGIKLVVDVPATDPATSVPARLFGFGAKTYSGNSVSRDADKLRVVLADEVLRDLPTTFELSGASGIVLANYDRLTLPETDERTDLLVALANAIAQAPRSPWPENVEKLPSIYVYFGQFLAHDLSRLYPVSKDKFVNLNSAALDLNTIFWDQGSAPADLATLYLDGQVESEDGVGVGLTSFSGYTPEHADLPRRADGTPLMPDCRSDANVFLAQMHVGFARCYILLKRSGDPDSVKTLRDAIHEITLFDFLPRLIDAQTWADVMTNGRKIVSPGQSPPVSFQIPIEFAAAIFRFGHAMVREAYTWSRTGNVGKATHRLLANTKAGGDLVPAGANGNKVLAFDWPATWSDSDSSQASNTARPICPAIAPDLTRIGPEHLPDATAPSNLAQLTLIRGQQLELPAAQTLWSAHSASLPGSPLTAQQIVEAQPAEVASVLMAPSPYGRLCDRTPLWFYTLRESQFHHDGARLGPLAGRIVMETLHAAVAASRQGQPLCRRGITLSQILSPVHPADPDAP